jgi:hypothetical protein
MGLEQLSFVVEFKLGFRIKISNVKLKLNRKKFKKWGGVGGSPPPQKKYFYCNFDIFNSYNIVCVNFY